MTKQALDVQHNDISVQNELSDNVTIGAASNGAKVCNLEPPNSPKSRCLSTTIKAVGGVIPSSDLRDFTTIQLSLKFPHHSSLPNDYNSLVPDHPIFDEFLSLHRYLSLTFFY